MSSLHDILTPRDKEIQSLFARGKAPEIIAIRLGIKISKVLLPIAMVPGAEWASSASHFAVRNSLPSDSYPA